MNQNASGAPASSDEMHCLDDVPADLVDWDVALRRLNRVYDLGLAVARATTPEGRRAATSRRDAELGADQPLPARPETARLAEAARRGDAAARTALGRALLGLVTSLPSLLRACAAFHDEQVASQLARTSVALALQRLETGAFPSALQGKGPLGLAPSMGYVFEFSGGGDAYTYLAVPERQGETGLRAFCADAGGRPA